MNWRVLLLALPVAGALAAVSLGSRSEEVEPLTDAADAPSGTEVRDAPTLETTGKERAPRKELVAGEKEQPAAPTVPPRVARAYEYAQQLLADGKPNQAMKLLKKFTSEYPAWFAVASRAAFVASVEKALVQVEREQVDFDLDGLIDRAARWGTLRKDDDLSALAQRAHASAEVIGRLPPGKGRNAMTRHIRRFVVGTHARSQSDIVSRRGKKRVDVDGLLDRANARTDRGTAEPLPVDDPAEVEKRRLEELERLRHAGALDLLDTVAASLAWLAVHQDADGHFSDRAALAVLNASSEDGDEVPAPKTFQLTRNYDLANTAMATLAFLDFRDQDTRGLFEPTLSRAIAWILKQQTPDGGFGKVLGSYYAQAMAVMALGQAAASTNRPDLRTAAARGLKWLYAQRDARGGFRYRKGHAGDLSVSAWVAQALEAASWGDVEEPEGMRDDLAGFLRTTWGGKANFSYMPGRHPSRTLAAAGMLTATILLPERDTTSEGDVWKAAVVTLWPRHPRNLYARYYHVRMAAKLHPKLPAKMTQALLEHARLQHADDLLAGAFDERARWLSLSGVTGVTAFTTLMFEHALYAR